MAYTKRTCNQCGYRDIQPNMVQREISYHSGSSKRSVSATTFIGAALGDKKSTRSIVDSVFNTQGRKYTRTRKVWLCTECSGDAERERMAKRKAIEDAENEEKKKLARIAAQKRAAERAEKKKLARIEARKIKAEKAETRKLEKEQQAAVLEYLRGNSKEEIFRQVQEGNAEDNSELKETPISLTRLRKDALRGKPAIFMHSVLACIIAFVLLLVVSMSLDIAGVIVSEQAINFMAISTLLGLPVLFLYRWKALRKRRLRAIDHFKGLINAK